MNEELDEHEDNLGATIYHDFDCNFNPCKCRPDGLISLSASITADEKEVLRRLYVGFDALNQIDRLVEVPSHVKRIAREALETIQRPPANDRECFSCAFPIVEHSAGDSVVCLNNLTVACEARFERETWEDRPK